MLKWVDDLVEEELSGCSGDGEIDKTKCTIVDFERYIKDNGVIC